MTASKGAVAYEVREGDCVEVMAGMEAESVDAVVCDPPYGLEFMGKDWDKFATGRSAKYAKGGALNETKSVTPKGGTNLPIGPSYVHRPAKRCSNCGKQAWSGSPCECPEPRWTMDNSALHTFQAWCEAWAREALRVLKPGGHLLAFGGTRTYHRLASGLEDAGFEIRDCLVWLYGSGFPKSLDVSKAIDKAAGAERESRPDPRWGEKYPNGNGGGQSEKLRQAAHVHDGPMMTSDPATPDAERWDGWGTALKPAHEPIVLARKPLAGTVAGNVLAHGTGALNVDGCRIGGGEIRAMPGDKGRGGTQSIGAFSGADPYETTSGRWPANVLLDPEAAAMLDRQSGDLGRSAGGRIGNAGGGSVENVPTGDFRAGDPGFGDAGGASRFFYCAKASSAERNAGLAGFDSDVTDDGRHKSIDNPYLRGETTRRNVHPTVKPIELMRWLVRLVTPPGGTVLDPFAGSGTTGCAAVLEGFGFVGIEREAEYLAIAEARIGWWAEHPEGVALVAALAAEGKRQAVAETGQLGIFDVGDEAA